ncbi:MAG TPA: hypothetical protein VGC79_36865, partial [Polyangiaceae bacterium]
TQAKIKQGRAQLENLVATRSQLASTLKPLRERFNQQLKTAKAARARQQAALSKSAKVTLSQAELLQAARSEYQAALSSAQALSKQTAALYGVSGNVLTLAGDLKFALFYSDQANLDSQEAATLISALSADLSNTSLKQPSAAATAAANKGKLRAEQAVNAAKAVKEAALLATKEAKAAIAIAGTDAARSAANSQSFKDDKQAQADLANTQKALTEIDVELQAAGKGGAPAAGAAPGKCDVQQVDFFNFNAYPGSYKAYKNGKAILDYASDRPPFIAKDGVQYADLNGNGVKEAIVFITMSGLGPHGGDEGELYFFEYDAQCTLKVLDWCGGGVGQGQVKGRSYVYPETQYGTPEGMSGNFPVGTDEVEVKLVNGKLKEIKRKSQRQ